MYRVTKENLKETCEKILPLRAKNEPSLGTVTQDIRQCVNDDCCRLGLTFLGSIPAENNHQEKQLHACQCCKQVFVDDDLRAVHGTVPEYLESLHNKRGDFTIILGSKAARMGIALAHK